VLHEALRRIEALLKLPTPASFFQRLLDTKHLDALPDMRPLLGAKRMLLDQAQVDDALETSVWGIESRRRSTAVWLPRTSGKAVMEHYGWARTKFAEPTAGPPWGNSDNGLVWDLLQLPELTDNETVRLATLKYWPSVDFHRWLV
jgi:hypothetical protein